jgi:hypothetical protein
MADKIQEKLLDSNLGQLRIPKAFKDRYGTPTRYPNPDWKVGEETDTTIELIYIFDKVSLEKQKAIEIK